MNLVERNLEFIFDVTIETVVAVILFVSLIALTAVFQLALALGAPWGRLAWGGQYPGKLPVGYRIASGVAMVVYGFIAALALDRAGALNLFADGFAQVGMWVVCGFFTFGTLMNAFSRSKPERFVMTPVAFSLAVLALLIALGDG